MGNSMGKKIILVAAVALMAVILIVGIFILPNFFDSRDQQSSSVDEIQSNELNSSPSDEGDFMNQDSSSGNQPTGSESTDNDVSGQSSVSSENETVIDTDQDSIPPDASTPEAEQEFQAIATSMITKGLSEGNFENYIADSEDIPLARRTQDNWAYLLANGGDITALLGAAERFNIRIEDTEVLSANAHDTLYQIRYRFTAHRTEAMDLSDTLEDIDGIATALVRVNSEGKVIQYEESIEW